MPFSEDYAKLREQAKSVRAALEGAFGPDTAYPGTVGDSRSAGHCAAVAVVFHALCGGEFVSSLVCGSSHWFNRIRLGDGTFFDLDLTADQFGHESVRVAPAGNLYASTKRRDRAELQPETLVRAARLAERSGLAIEISSIRE